MKDNKNRDPPHCLEVKNLKTKTTSFWTEQHNNHSPTLKSPIKIKEKVTDYTSYEPNEEIIYEYEENDVESENRVLSIFDSNEGSIIETTTDVPLLASESRASDENESSFYNLRAPYRNEFSSHSFIKYPKISKPHNNSKRSQKFKVQKGDILRHSSKRNKNKSIDFKLTPNHQWNASDDCKLSMKEVEETAPDVTQLDSFILIPEFNIDSKQDWSRDNNTKMNDEIAHVQKKARAFNNYSNERILNEMLLNPIKASYNDISLHKHSHSVVDIEKKNERSKIQGLS